MAIALRGVGTAAIASTTAATTLTPTLPAGWQPGDIHLLLITLGGGPVSSISDYGGFTSKVSREDGASVGLVVAWRRAQVGDTAPVIRVDTVVADPTIAQIIGFSGCVASGDPISATSGQTNGASTTVTCPAVTPADANSMIVLALGANGNTNASGYSGTDPTFTEALDTASALSGGGLLAAAYGTRSTATSTGTRTATLGASVTSAAIMVALRAAADSAALSGSIPVTVTPVGSLAARTSLDGGIPIAVTPSGTLSTALRAALAGSIPASVAPSGTLTLRTALAGTLPVTVTPSGTLGLEGRASLAGTIPAAVVPSGVLTAGEIPVPVADAVGRSGAPETLTYQASTVRVRHVTMCDEGDPGAVEVLGKYFRGDWGINGELGWQKGSYSLRIGEEGDFTLELPNAIGSDGRRHLDRLAIARIGRARPLPGGVLEYSGGAYRPGDEWFEIYEGNGATPLFVGTPTKAVVTKQRITVTGWDGWWRLKKTREFQAGFWRHAPRDVIEHYTGIWDCVWADDMQSGYRDRSSDGATFSGGTATLTRAIADPTAAYLSTGPSGGFSYPSDATSFRVDTVVNVPRGVAGGMSMLAVSTSPVADVNPTNGLCSLTMTHDGGLVGAYVYSGGLQLGTIVGAVPLGTSMALAIEVRLGWAYFYVNGTLVAALQPRASSGGDLYAGVLTSSGGAAAMTVDNLMVRLLRPFLLRGSARGDYRLPGAPTPGGLFAQYYDGADDLAKGRAYSELLAPTKEPVATRVDPFIGDLSTASRPPAWPAVGLQQNFAVRWSGAINMGPGTNLSLDQFADVRMRVAADDQVTVWLGNTVTPMLVAGTGGGYATSGDLHPWVGDAGGWYPIVIEYIQATDGGGVVLEFSNNGGRTWFGQAGVALSPYGVVLDHVRNDSHYDVLKTVADSYGYQLTCEPRSLESGEFPGQVIPRLRQGRDTAKVVDEPRAWNLSDSVDAEGVADAWMADAAGISDPNGTAQLTAEMVNYDQATEHLGLLTEYEGLAEISQKPMLEQRLQSLVALSAAPWEEVAIDADGYRELVDVWPLPASSASEPSLFAWQPGDGVRINAPSLGVIDPSPRQIMGITRDFTPDGLKPPRAAFRQRPRDFAAVLRQLKRQALLPQRNYQGGLVERAGTAGGSPSNYSIVFGPTNPADIARATLVVRNKTDNSPWNVDVGGVVRFAVTTNGNYDVTPWVGGGRQYARLLSQGVGSTGFWECVLVLTFRI